MKHHHSWDTIQRYFRACSALPVGALIDHPQISNSQDPQFKQPCIVTQTHNNKRERKRKYVKEPPPAACAAKSDPNFIDFFLPSIFCLFHSLLTYHSHPPSWRPIDHSFIILPRPSHLQGPNDPMTQAIMTITCKPVIST